MPTVVLQNNTQGCTGFIDLDKYKSYFDDKPKGQIFLDDKRKLRRGTRSDLKGGLGYLPVGSIGNRSTDIIVYLLENITEEDLIQDQMSKLCLDDKVETDLDKVTVKISHMTLDNTKDDPKIETVTKDMSNLSINSQYQFKFFK